MLNSFKGSDHVRFTIPGMSLLPCTIFTANIRCHLPVVNTNWSIVEVDYKKVALDQLNWMDMFCVKLGYSMMGNL
jgi:hypothetical protein